MEIIRGDGEQLKNIDLTPANLYKDVIQNVAVILATIQRSCPLLRDMGITGEVIDRPIPVAKNILVAEIYDQIEAYEPRAVIGGISFESDDLRGVLVPIVTLEGVNDDD